jgi:hypothetical protein
MQKMLQIRFEHEGGFFGLKCHAWKVPIDRITALVIFSHKVITKCKLDAKSAWQQQTNLIRIQNISF